MKKILAILSLTAFMAVSVTAQTTQPAPVEKKETVEKAEAKSTPSCCKKANASCCKSSKEAKACTPEKKAACEKASAAATK
jgi:hypothetical protein